jgi:integrase
VRARTLLVEQALVDGELKGQKTNRPPRTVDLLPSLARDLAEWRLATGRPARDAYVFSAAGGGPWRDHDWRNWRKRVYVPAAAAAGVEAPRPYDLRHSFASLLIHEGRHSMFELGPERAKAPHIRGFEEEPTGGLEPPTPSLRVMCSTS